MGGNLAVLPGSAALVPSEPRIFRVFISYASEDAPIAEAIDKCLTTALDDHFAEIYWDRGFLQAGDKFKEEIESKLERSDVLIIVYTGATKASHGYTGWEVGYFDALMKAHPNKRKVPLFLQSLPATATDDQGVSLNIGPDKLQLTHTEFEAGLTIDSDDPLCKMIETWQDSVADLTKAAGFQKKDLRPEQNAASCVKTLRLEIFRYLKTTVDITLKPQKQITIKAKGAALQQSDSDLPPDAQLVPVGSGGSMAIFGLPDVSTTWEKFLQATSGSKFQDSWRDAITSVVMSSFPALINVDNSQVILSNDETKAYRIILTTATRYYDDNREFNLYFVEALRRPDYGDQSTTLLLKGLDLVCRFRSLFLEDDSEFGFQNVQNLSPEPFLRLASQLPKELNLLRKDSQEAGLDQPKVWRKFVTWDHIDKMGRDYRPREAKMRETISRIATAKGQPDQLIQLRQQLSDVLKDIAETIRPENTLLLHEMASKLQEIAGEVKGT
jgi:hypothetical protein